MDLQNRWGDDGQNWFWGTNEHAALVRAQKQSNGELRSLLAVPFALFAYGGLRSVPDGVVSGVQDLTDNPHHGATVFHRPEGTRPLLQWMINTATRQALSAMKGASHRASTSVAALNRLRDALRFVTGTDIQFEVAEDSLSMQVSMGSGPLVPIDQLPDGLKSLLSWLGDLLMRLDRMPWTTPEPVTDRRFILLLDEVEVHLHPAWQRRVIPMVERLFPNAQIIASTHSPFVIGSATDAWIHAFRLEGANAVVDPPQPSARGTSYPAILESIMGVDQEFDVDSEADLTRFRELWHARLKGDTTADAPLEALRLALGQRSEELGVIVETELRDLRRRLQRARGDAA